MIKPKSFVPKSRSPAQKAVLDEARKRAFAVLTEKNKIIKSMKAEQAEETETETTEKNDEVVNTVGEEK